MKKFTKIVLILAAVCMVFGSVITAAASSLGGRVPVRVALNDETFSRLFYRAFHHVPGRVHLWDDDYEFFDDDDDRDDYDDDGRDAYDDRDDYEDYEVYGGYNGYGYCYDYTDAHGHQERHHGISGSGVSNPVPDDGQQKTPEISEYQDRFSSESRFKELKVRADAAAVEIIEGSGDTFLYVTEATEYIEWSWKIDDDDTLEVYFRRKKGLGKLAAGQKSSACLIIPKDHSFQEIDLEGKAGVIYAGSLTTGKLEISSSASSIDIEDGSVGELEIDCKAGQATFSGTVERKLEADCEAGNVGLTLDGNKKDFNYEIEASMGNVTVGDVSYSGLKEKKELFHEGAGKTVELDCNMGVIDVRFEE